MSAAGRRGTHVCLVSDNLLPNLIPALMEPPARAYLLASDDMAAKGLPRRLERILVERGVAVTIRGGLPASPFSELVAYAGAFAGELRGGETPGPVVLNATGGNKLMALAFVEAFRALPGVDVIYADTANSTIASLTDRERPARPMRGVLDVPTYLAAQGFSWRCAASERPAWRAQAERLRDLSEWLAENAGELDAFLGAINQCASDALDRDGRLSEPIQTLRKPPRGPWRSALRRIAGTGLLDWDGERELRFPDPEAARYLSGGWLEQWAWLVARERHPDDLRAGAEGTWDSPQGHGSPNELDLLVVHDNRILVVECKTARFGRLDVKDQDIVYKLDSLGRGAGGPFGGRLLLSARTLTAHAAGRARGRDIKVIHGADLPLFGPFLRGWMEA